MSHLILKRIRDTHVLVVHVLWIVRQTLYGLWDCVGMASHMGPESRSCTFPLGLCSEKLVREKNYVPTVTGKSCSCVLSILGGCYKLLLQALLLIIVLFSFSNQVAQELKICASIINMFYLIPAASSKLIEPLINLVLKVEKSLLMEVSDGQDWYVLKKRSSHPRSNRTFPDKEDFITLALIKPLATKRTMERWKKIRHHIPNNVWFYHSCILYFYDWFSGWKSPTRTTVEVPDSISHSDCGFLLITTFWFSDEPFAHGKYAVIRRLIYYCLRFVRKTRRVFKERFVWELVHYRSFPFEVRQPYWCL